MCQVPPKNSTSLPPLQKNTGDLVYVGGELSEETILQAYARGCFPWSGEAPIPWYSPDPRLVLFPREFKESRNLRRLARSCRYQVRFDTRFRAIMEGCRQIGRKDQNGSWITKNMIDVYTRLHLRGLCHSVEVYREDELVGGLYGLCLGKAFFGESMFSKEPNTSKLALYALCRHLKEHGFHFVDCQQVTGHLMRMGAVPLARNNYLYRLKRALRGNSLEGYWSCPQDWMHPR